MAKENEFELSSAGAMDAAKNILDSPFGAHCLVVYSDLKKCREFYSTYIHEVIKKDDEIVLFAPFYETENSVRHTLSHQYHKIINLDEVDNIESKLIIIDSLRKYFRNLNMVQDYESNQRLVDSAKELGKKGATVICDTGAFGYQHKTQELIEYEMLLPSHYDINLKGICLYHYKDFSMLSKDIIQNLINHHEIGISID